MRRLALAPILTLSFAAGCGKSGAPSAGGTTAGASHSGARLTVVAAENFWGSIAAQLGGARADVSSIIVNPNTDPHSYEPDAQAARTLAGAKLVIVNGLGYDNWAERLLNGSPAAGRVVLNVGKLIGLPAGSNPHQWYSPEHVHLVIDRVSAMYESLDRAHAGYFARQRQSLLSESLARYDALRSEIRTRYAGVPVGYSESIFQPLGEDLHLKLMTPYSFTKAIAEGTDVTAQDKQTVDAQASRRQIKVWVFNTQNVTPDVRRVNAIAREHNIPTATVTETLTPPSASFEQWQVIELEALRSALSRATGK